MENKAGNTTIKDAIVLCVITLVAGLLLGLVYEVTKESIAAQKLASQLSAYQAVFTEADSFKMNDRLTDLVSDGTDLLASAPNSFGNTVIDNAVEAVDSSGTVIGYVVSSTSKDGYGGNIGLSVGIDLEGTIQGIEILEIDETPGLGMNANNDTFKDSFKDKNVDAFVVVKSGSSSDNEIDSISGATITTNAVVNAVNAAVYFASCINE